uniref:L-aspartate oxidase n=1 Tax=Albugo laibachii Nc14 TaxID=890382 RepID=F0WLZ3_9STRA|nr:Laspartate oxidase putative [Albugo laibachii Nc14]|eukprot:CCA22320.1 Laspartate oxidase putative [Albugo laibachii Nc14]
MTQLDVALITAGFLGQSDACKFHAHDKQYVLDPLTPSNSSTTSSTLSSPGNVTFKSRCFSALVIGCGIAGCSAALYLAQQGIKVVVISGADDPNDCATYWAQGGIIYRGHNDSSDLLASDIHKAGAGLCEDSAVQKLASEGPALVEKVLLNEIKVPFTRDESGKLALTLEASHNRARILYKADHSGKAISESMIDAVARNSNIELVMGRSVYELVKNLEGVCIGALTITKSNQIELFRSPYTILATGGIGDIYLNTSNPETAKGEGIALAARIGAHLKNLQYVQFHPTTLFIPGERRFLLTEALRGEGAILRDHNGRAFAKDYHEAGELAPRDVVARMILAEMEKHDRMCMYLDISHKDADWIRLRFPTIHQHCLSRSIDMTKDVIPIVPAAHYHCGGIEVDLDGRTSIDGLYAAGEVSCTGLHGANRLASSSLLEGLIWGNAAAIHIAKQLCNCFSDPAGCDTIADEFVIYHHGTKLPPVKEFEDVMRTTRTLMWEFLGPLRTRVGMAAAVKKLKALDVHTERLYAECVLSIESTKCRNAVRCAKEIAGAALESQIVAGTHFVVSESNSAT